MPQSIVIPEKTAADTSEAFIVEPWNVPVTVTTWGLDGSEEVVIQYDPGNGVFVDMADAGSIITQTEPSKVLDSGGIYRIRKTVTVGLAGVAIFSK